MNQLGAQAYADALAEGSVVKKSPDLARLRAVGGRISSVAQRDEYAWEFSLIEAETINAWCLPGGYIAFYTGILPVLRSEAGMAFVMGHEVGHALARHSAERMTQSLGVAGAITLVDLFLSGGTELTETQRGLIVGALGLGAEIGVMLPFSRSHEKEADIVGMMLMAEAGYPPVESIEVWKRMEAVAGKGPPAFLSTHPSNDARIDNQKEWMPEARKKYQRASQVGNALQAVW
ncbi:MAG: M48 family metallopeptidase [Alphaproteobacteria bacterium]|nr:M48 family metallopeptidase [Alphaproteobacteria bacterium]